MIFIYSQKAIKKLTIKIKKKTGHNNSGKIVIDHIGSVPNKNFRLIDSKHYLQSILGKVVRFEQDPYRTTLLALIAYTNGMLSLILKPVNLKLSDSICNSGLAPFLPGNSLQLKDIPIGSHIHNIELYPGLGSQIIRAAGCYGQLLRKTLNKALVRLRSGEIRQIPINCYATLGILDLKNRYNVFKSNFTNLLLTKENLRFNNNNFAFSTKTNFVKKSVKAGRSRWLGIRPHVRGSAMNPIDHPHGGKSMGRPSVTPWGLLTKGKKTRKKNKNSINILIARKKK